MPAVQRAEETNEVLDKLAYTRWLTDCARWRNPSKNTPPREMREMGACGRKKVTV
jgi:hypothetical protein